MPLISNDDDLPPAAKRALELIQDAIEDLPDHDKMALLCTLTTLSIVEWADTPQDAFNMGDVLAASLKEMVDDTFVPVRLS